MRKLDGLGQFTDLTSALAEIERASHESDVDVDKAIAGKVAKGGDTMTGPLVLPAAPTADLQAATKKYVDDSVSGAVAAHAITNAKLAQMAAGTVKANVTGALADAADVTLASLATAMAVVPGVDAEILGQIAGQQQQTGTTYTLVLADKGKIIEIANAAAIALTIPPNSSVAFPVGTLFNVTQTGAGVITFTAGAGVTIQQRQSKFRTGGQWAMATLYQQAANVWVLGGDVQI